MKSVRSEFTTVSADLTPTDKLTYGNELADKVAKIDTLKNRLKMEQQRVKAIVDQLSKDVEKLAYALNTGKHEIEVECVFIPDVEKRRFLVKDAETLVLYKTVSMTDSEVKKHANRDLFEDSSIRVLPQPEDDETTYPQKVEGLKDAA
jgi:hypothetical protein